MRPATHPAQARTHFVFILFLFLTSLFSFFDSTNDWTLVSPHLHATLCADPKTNTQMSDSGHWPPAAVLQVDRMMPFQLRLDVTLALQAPAHASPTLTSNPRTILMIDDMHWLRDGGGSSGDDDSGRSLINDTNAFGLDSPCTRLTQCL